MSVSCCMHYALAIGRTPDDTWAAQIALIPEVCPRPSMCSQPHNCRVRNADYLRVQYRAIKHRQQREAGGAHRQGALL